MNSSNFVKFRRILCRLALGIATVLILSSIVFAESTSASQPRPFAGFGLIITIIMLVQIGKADKAAVKEAHNKIIGVAGWLLFVIGILAINGALAIINVANSLIQAIIFASYLFLTPAFIITMLLDLATSIGFLIAAFRLWKVKIGARWLAVVIIILDLLVVGINSIISPDDPYVVLSIIGSFWNVIILLYLLTSRRVSNTYARKAVLPKLQASSNSTVKSWLGVQAVGALVLVIILQAAAWSELLEQGPLTEQQHNLLGEYDEKVEHLNSIIQQMNEQIESLGIKAETGANSGYYSTAAQYIEKYYEFDESSKNFLTFLEERKSDLMMIEFNVDEQRNTLIETRTAYTEIYNMVKAQEAEPLARTPIAPIPTRKHLEPYKWYTSREASTKYYCSTDQEWKRIPLESLLEFSYEKDLQQTYPSRSLNQPCQD